MIKSHDTIVKQSSRAMNYAAAKKKEKTNFVLVRTSVQFVFPCNDVICERKWICTENV